MADRYNLNVESMPAELRLLLAIVGIDHAPELPGQLVRRYPDIDWDRFIELTRHHRVSPLIHANAKRAGDGLLPERVAKAMHHDYTRNTFQMLHLSAEMQRVCAAFEESGIRALLAKGPLLAEQLYGDTSLRTCKDLDILVPHEDLERASEILRGFGYEAEEAKAPDAMTKVREHEMAYFHAQKNIQIELHWRLNWKAWEEPTFDEMWARRKVIPFKGTPMNSFSDEDLFLTLTTHGARHGWFRLRWLADIDRFMEQKLDWGRVVSLLDDYMSAHIGAQALILCSKLFGTTVHEKLSLLKPKRRAYRLAHLAIERIQGRGAHQYVLSLVQGNARRKYAMYLFKPKPWDTEIIRLPRGLHFLYYPLRPLLYCWRRLAKRQGLTKEM